MICPNCGTELSDFARFCPNCGQAQEKDAPFPEVEYETCEIVWNQVIPAQGKKKKPSKEFFVGNFYFWARVVGPKGTYSTGQTTEIPFTVKNHDPSNEQTVELLNALVKELESSGWERVGKGEAWFSYQFRRRIQAP